MNELIRNLKVGRFNKEGELTSLAKGIYTFRCKNTLNGYNLANFRIALTGTSKDNAEKLKTLFGEYKRRQRLKFQNYCSVKVTGLSYERSK